ncbi:MAG: bifunctional riboflavin kinase/FAD synthetase [Actinomycetota bacterium]|jgi:riboflavin kinase/FMN adenylyltransferase|nr:bifunctional riboflavin kinase/FAD synthetase [Actinomycetota bacterium]MDA8281582.1 bifunctional riboflavin kinase/FAD synthetase [Actinomycetota bacterium]
MEVVTGPENCVPPAGGSAVTIGAYDGVHLGHQELIAGLRSRAAARNLESVVVTFDRHPATVVRPGSAPLLLTELDQKLELLAATGVDRTLIVPFDRARADETAEQFVTEVLVGALRTRLVVVGEGFHFGHDRKGDVALLRDLGRVHDFDVVGWRLASDGSGAPLSSTRIRGLLAAGDVAGAAAFLGRPHQVRGTVVHGDGRGGRELGMPTANVELAPGTALPDDGVYAGWYARPDGVRHPAALSLGRRPTFYQDGAPLLLEAHLIGFDGDLYGERAQVSFVARLRPELRFGSVAELATQMHQDVRVAADALGVTA